MSDNPAKNFGGRLTGGSYIGPKVQIKGRVTGAEAVLIAGQVQGSIDVESEQVVVAPGGRVQANINALMVSIQGAVRGDVNGARRVELRKAGALEGNLTTARIFIEEGAKLRGCVDMVAEVEEAPPEKPAARPAPAQAAGGPAKQAPQS